MWISCVRIIAAVFIYIFHFQRLYNLPHYSLDMYGISLFLFISGFFSCQRNRSLHVWLLKRFMSIMIPYWSVILVVLFINDVIKYKQTTLISNIIVFLGGSMFLEDPVYVISWYITLILLFYIGVYMVKLLKYIWLQVPFFIILFFIFLYVTKEPILYFIAFVVGYGAKCFSEFCPRILFHKLNFLDRVNKILFIVQNHCYSFFLIHGGILLFLITVLRLNKALSFILGFIITSLCAYYHNMLSDFILKKLERRLREKFST